jgi:hypothetical protein
MNSREQDEKIRKELYEIQSELADLYKELSVVVDRLKKLYNTYQHLGRNYERDMNGDDFIGTYHPHPEEAPPTWRAAYFQNKLLQKPKKKSFLRRLLPWLK